MKKDGSTVEKKKKLFFSNKISESLNFTEPKEH